MEVSTVVRFDSFYFLRVRRDAMRRGVWFRVLSSTERALLNLVPQCVGLPKSARLIGILADIVVKVKSALQSRIAVLTRQVGKPLARRLSGIAMNWGHKTAGEWAMDERFSRYLAIVDMNSISTFRVGGDRFG